jgi:hypothetical protein
VTCNTKLRFQGLIDLPKSKQRFDITEPLGLVDQPLERGGKFKQAFLRG